MSDGVPLQHVQAGTDVDLLFMPKQAAEELMAAHPYFCDVAQSWQSELLDALGRRRTNAPATATGLAGSTPSSPATAGPLESAHAVELIAQRLALLQASIVNNGREMRTRMDSLQDHVFQRMERNDAKTRDAIEQISARVDALSQNIDHPQRAAKASRVAFAPRHSSTAASSTGMSPNQSFIKRSDRRASDAA